MTPTYGPGRLEAEFYQTRVLGITQTASRRYLDLSGEWLFRVDREEPGEKQGYFGESVATSDWQKVIVPCTFSACGPDLEWYQGVGWFRRSFDLPQSLRGRRLSLRFEGLANLATVWINGRLVKESQLPYLPLEVPLKGLVRYGRSNLVVVRVSNRPPPSGIPYIGWFHDGGILREVGIVATNPLHLEDLVITAEPSADGGISSIRASLRNESSRSVEAAVCVEILDTDGRSLASAASDALPLLPGAIAEQLVVCRLAEAEPWCPERPTLYTARVSLRAGKKVVDSRDVRFGFRRVEAKGTAIHLNGKPIFLLGLNRHEDTPRSGMALDYPQLREDLSRIKGLGANFVRLCHYPHSPAELSLCDEMGLLVLCEVPTGLWQLNPDADPQLHHRVAREMLTGMIQRDRNHPSVILWSVSNESAEQEPEVGQSNEALLQLARELDPSRLCVHVSHPGNWGRHVYSPAASVQGRDLYVFDQDDVICVNGYPTIDRRLHASRKDWDYAESGRLWVRDLAEVRQRYPDKPILVTEFGYECNTGDAGVDEGRSFEVQARTIESEFEALRSIPYVTGAAIWVYADHRWPWPGRVSPYGIYLRDRTPKKAPAVVESVFRRERERRRQLGRGDC